MGWNNKALLIIEGSSLLIPILGTSMYFVVERSISLDDLTSLHEIFVFDFYINLTINYKIMIAYVRLMFDA